MSVCDETSQITMGFLLPEKDWIAQNDEILGGHPEDFKPEQPGV